MASDDRHGPVRERVAELLVATPDGRRRGSGYRITDRLVLTAAHVVAGAESVVARFEADLPGEWSAKAQPTWRDEEADLALLTIEPRAGEPPIEPAAIGVVDGADALPVCVVGFPRWKLRSDKRPYRDSHQLLGTVAPLSNWREGTLEVTAAFGGPPGPSWVPSKPRSTSWEGMSGAAVWSGRHIIGVIASHHPYDGSGRLAASRIDPLPPIPGEPSRREKAGSVASPVMSAYREQLKDIAPVELVDREREMGELYWFCQGDEPYAWWEAGPWTGKTALLSTFALRAHPDLEVVSFFITRRFAGQSDSEAYTEAMIEQLAAVAGEPVSPTGAKHGYLLHLLRQAADRCARSGRGLALVVDGLDEDTGHGSLPSIASLLPKHPPPGVHIVVASRPNPPLPDDVPDNHPLWTVRRRELRTSGFVECVERQARQELSRWLVNPGLQRDVFGLITASGGGLTRRDMLELTGQVPVRLTVLLGGTLGRSLDSRSQWEAVVDRPPEDAFLFAHETLKEIAEEQLGPEVARYREQLHEWADGYRERRWPKDTPVYLLRGYRRLLTETRDLDRLYECAVDRARHDRMLDLTGGDALALSEVTAAIELHAAAEHPDLARLIVLAVQRADLHERNGDFPPELLGLWARIGQVGRARALAAGIVDPLRLSRALSHIAVAALRRGDEGLGAELLEEAHGARQEVARWDGSGHALLLLETAVALVEIDRRGLARPLIDDLVRAWHHEGLRSFAWQRLWTYLPDRIDLSILLRNNRGGALTELVRASPRNEAYYRLLPSMAAAAMIAGDFERARELKAEAVSFGARGATSVAIGRELAAAGEPDLAAWALSDISNDRDEFDGLVALAESWARLGNPVRAQDCWQAASRIVGRLGEPDLFRLRVVEAEVRACSRGRIPVRSPAARWAAQHGADFTTTIGLRCRWLVASVAAGDRREAELRAAEIRALAWTGGADAVDPVLLVLGDAWAAAGDNDAAAALATEVERRLRGDVSWKKDPVIRQQVALGLVEGGDAVRGLTATVRFGAAADNFIDNFLKRDPDRVLELIGSIADIGERLKLLHYVAELALMDEAGELLPVLRRMTTEAALEGSDDDRAFGTELAAGIEVVMNGGEVDVRHVLSAAQRVAPNRRARRPGWPRGVSDYFEKISPLIGTDDLRTEAELVKHLVTTPAPLLGTAGKIDLPALQRAFDFLISRE